MSLSMRVTKEWLPPEVGLKQLWSCSKYSANYFSLRLYSLPYWYCNIYNILYFMHFHPSLLEKINKKILSIKKKKKKKGRQKGKLEINR